MNFWWKQRLSNMHLILGGPRRAPRPIGERAQKAVGEHSTLNPETPNLGSGVQWVERDHHGSPTTLSETCHVLVKRL